MIAYVPVAAGSSEFLARVRRASASSVAFSRTGRGPDGAICAYMPTLPRHRERSVAIQRRGRAEFLGEAARFLNDTGLRRPLMDRRVASLLAMMVPEPNSAKLPEKDTYASEKARLAAKLNTPPRGRSASNTAPGLT